MATAVTALMLLISGSAQAAGPGDVFLTGGLELPPGAVAGGSGGYSDGDPTGLGISGNGRYVAFAADADALSPEAHPDVTNVFRKDRATGDVVLVSRATGANGAVATAGGRDVSISDDGGRVAWVTSAALDPADGDDADDVYVRDIASAETILATPGITTDVSEYGLSGNGSFVAFATTAALAGGSDVNGVSDVYRRRLSDGATALVSRPGIAPAGNGASSDPSISDDGRWVAFASVATDLVAGFVDGNGPARDIFARDVSGLATHLVSKVGAGNNGANAGSRDPRIAGTPADALAGVHIAYDSDATNLAAADAAGAESVYRRRLSENSSVLISRATGGANADSRAHVGGISDTGAKVAFASDAGNLGAGADYYGVYVRDVGAGTTILGSVDNAYAVEPAISGDGSVVAWLNGSGGITPDSDRDLVGVFARALPGGAAEYVSRPPGSAPFLAPATPTETPETGMRTISADGRHVVFAGYSTRLPGNESGGGQVYRRDTLTGAIELVSRTDGGAPADSASREPSISADGRRVAFTSFAKLVAADTDAAASVYVRDLAAGTTTLVSRADGPDGALPNQGSSEPRISAGGHNVVFLSTATNLGAADGKAHIYLRDLAAARTRLVDRATGAGGAIGNDDSDGFSVSADGQLVAFATRANNLDPSDPAPSTLRDVYVRDTVAETTALVSRRSGHDGAKAAGSSFDPVLSADGRVVAFIADDQALAPEAGPWGGNRQVVARDLATAQNALASRAAAGAVADRNAQDPSVNGDGSVIAFASAATNLLGGVGGANRHGVFARTMATGAVSGPPAFGLAGDGLQYRATHPSLSDDGQCMAFHGFGHNAFTGAAGDFRTDYVFVVSGACPKPLPPGGGTQPPPAGGEQPRPAITGASMKRKRFRVGKRPTKKRVLAAARRAKAGTAFRFRLSAGAEVTIALHARAAGKRVGKSCRKPAPKLRKRKACVRFVKRGALVRGGLAAGKHSVAFSGRVGRKALRPGRYRATLVARNAGGKSDAVWLSFRVVKR
jgi:Tol biopolymer transport system component